VSGFRPVDMSAPLAVRGRLRRVEVRTAGTDEFRLALLMRPHPFAPERFALVKLGGRVGAAIVPWFAISETRKAGSSS
jgi:hypothetical protein